MIELNVINCIDLKFGVEEENYYWFVPKLNIMNCVDLKFGVYGGEWGMTELNRINLVDLRF